MRYWWDKIKVVTDDLTLWDDLQVLWFDTCGYILIWKWTNEYWTKWDPLTSTTEACGETTECPRCQSVITDVKKLPGWPEPCSNGDAFLMLSETGKLKTLCKSALEDKDEKVKISSSDWTAWYLWDKLIVCNSNSPLSFKENSSWSFHTMCLNWDGSKANMSFLDLNDTPNSYSKWLLYSNWGSVDILPPKACDKSRYSYVVYDKQNWAYDTICDPHEISCAYWEYSWGTAMVWETADWAQYYLQNTSTTVIPTAQTFSWGCSKFRSTDDIELSSGNVLFIVKTPWVYNFSYGCTVHNKDNAWLQAIRSCLLVWDYKLESKYDSRKYTQYVNDFLPDDWDSSYNLWERNLELAIMSFSNSAQLVITEPVTVQFRLWVSRALNDHRMKGMTNLSQMELTVTSGSDLWGATYVSCARIGPVPGSYKNRIW